MKKILLTITVCIAFLQNINAQIFEWAKGFGSSVQDDVQSVATDAAGNIYTVGNFRYTCDFDPDTGTREFTTPAGDADIFVQKLDADGKFLWAAQMGGTGWEGARGVAVENNVGIYVVGNFNSTVDFNPDTATAYNLTATGGDDIFIVKLNTSGGFQWAKNIGGSTTDEANGVAVDANGNVFVTGRFQGTADFNPGSGIENLTASGSTDDIFVCKFDASGNFVWAKGMGGSGNDVGLSIALDAGGNVYTTGYFYSTVNFNPGGGAFTLTAPGGGSDIFICKLNSSGDFVWAKNFGTTGWDVGYDIAVDANGTVFATGRFEGTVDFDNGSGINNLTADGVSDGYLMRLDQNGDYVWAHGFGGAFSEWGQSIDIDASNNVYFTGFYLGTVDFNPGSGTANLTSNGGEDIFISKFDANGNFIWAKSMGCDNANFGDRGQALEVDGNNNIITTGWFYGETDFDTDADTLKISPVGSFDIFVHKMSQPSTGIQENSILQSVSIYPNPTSGLLSIVLNEPADIQSVKLIDATGRLVDAGTEINGNRADVDLEESNGIYFAEVKLADGRKAYLKILKRD